MCVRERKRKREAGERERRGKGKRARSVNLTYEIRRECALFRDYRSDQSLDILAIARSARRERKREKESTMRATDVYSRCVSSGPDQRRTRARAWMVNERREI